MILQIQLANFRSHARTNLVLARFTLFAGPMGAGKSSIAHALSLILTGQNPLVNAKGEGLRREIREGETEFHIGLRFDNSTVIERKVTESKHAVGINGQYADVRRQQGAITALLGCSEDVVLSLLDPTRFFTREEKVQRKVLLQFMSKSEIEAPPLVKKLGLADSFRSISEVDQLIKQLKEERIRGLNNEVKALNATIPPPVEFEAARKADIEERVKELRAQRDQVIKSQAREAEWGKTSKALADRLEEAEIAAGPDAGTVLEALRRSEQAAKQKLGKLRADYFAKKAVRDSAQSEHDKLESQVEFLCALEGRVAGLDKTCPTCQRGMTEHEKKKITAKLRADREPLEVGLNGAKTGLAKLDQELAKLEADGKSEGGILATASKDLRELESKIQARDQAKEAVDSHNSQKPEGKASVEILNRVASFLAAAEIDLAVAQRLEEESGRRALQVAQAREKESAAEQLATAVRELADLKDQQLSASSGEFLSVMQSFVDTFKLGEVQFTLDPFGFSVGGLYADQLSGGQKVVLEAALRVAAAKQSGFKIMVLDDANMLTEFSRSQLAGALMKEGIQVIVCSMTDQQLKPANLPADVKMYWLTSPGITGPTSVKELGR